MDPVLLPSLVPWIICALAVFLGTILQRLSGAEYGMFAAPIMSIFSPEWMPGTVLLVGFLIGAGTIFSARNAVIWRDLPYGFLGRICGAAIAAFIAAAFVGTQTLGLVVGGVVLFAVALTLSGLTIAITKGSLFIAGGVGGVMGTLTGIGAPPMAILYANTDARRSAATQNAFYGFGTLSAILALLMAGVLTWAHWVFALTLAPAVPLAIWVSHPLAKRFERVAIRPWALGLVSCSAIILLLRSI